MNTEDCFYLGYITKTKGLKGEIQVYFDFERFDEIEFGTVFIEVNGKLVPYFVSSYKVHPNKTGYFFFEDIDSIEKAEKLLKKKVYLPNSEIPEREDDEFYYTDLKNFVVIDSKAGELGEITEVLEYPQQFIALVPYKFRELMFPLNEEIIDEIDEDEGILRVTLPDGLIELYTSEQ